MSKIKFGLFILVGIVICSVSRYESLGIELSEGYKVENINKGEGSKLSPKIREVVKKMESMGVTRSNVQNFEPEELSTPLVKVNSSGEVQAYIHVSEVNDSNLDRLRALGVKIEVVNAKHKIVQGWVPFDRLEGVADLSFVRKVTPPSYGETRTGSVNTEGDAILGSDDVRDTLGFDGTGVLVGVISDGVDSISASQATDDLPEDIIIGNDGNGDEGTALMEIIHDIAPGADLAFSSGFPTSVQFIDSIDFLVDVGADVIVDDLGFLDEPFFEDGIVAEEAENAVDEGVVFVSAGGNDADQHYQDLYIDGGSIGENLQNVHDFGLAAGGGSDVAMRVLVPPRRTINFVLQWNDPFGGSSNDYDLFLFNPSTGELIDSGIEVQNGDDDPIESAGVINSGSSNFRPVDIVINRFDGQRRTLEMFFNGPVRPQEFNVPGDSVFGHPAVRDVIAVGAVPSSNPNTIEPFSSRGPVSIFFPSSQMRPKPDVVAPDGVSTSVPGFDPFFGTSASAPHVAGVVALMLDKNPNLTSSQVRDDLVAFGASGVLRQADPIEVANVLEDTAVDLGQDGFDNIFGFGRVDAFEAVESIAEGDDGQDGNGDGEDSRNSGCSLAPQSASGGIGGVSNLFIILVLMLMVGLRRFYRRKV